MAIKNIVKVWNEDGLIDKNIEFLSKKTKRVFFPLTESTDKIINDLIDTYRKIPCAGVAANQIGYDKSIFIGIKEINDEVDTEEIEEKESKNEKEESNKYADNYEIYINPQIDRIDEKSIQEEIEGCLSIPFLSLRVGLNF